MAASRRLSTPQALLVLPSMKVSGGTQQALVLARELVARSCEIAVVSMWRTEHPLPTDLDLLHLSEFRSVSWRAGFQLPVVAVKFGRWLRSLRRQGMRPHLVIFTHYATLPLAMFVQRGRRCVFVQDLEWKFLRNAPLSWILRAVVLFFYRRSTVITANSYLSKSLGELGVAVTCEMPIWADPAFLVRSSDVHRDIDFAMVLRKGDHKRLDLYLAFIAQVRNLGPFRIAVISPEDEIADSVRTMVSICEARPSLEVMRSVYARTKCFVHLSDHEGFGLPPLEAMGSGCVPLCRDSGGIRAFMNTERLQPLLLPLSMPIDKVASAAAQLVADPARLAGFAQECQAAFTAGLDVQRRRAECIEVLMDEIAHARLTR